MNIVMVDEDLVPRMDQKLNSKFRVVRDKRVAVLLTTYLRDQMIIDTLEHYSKFPYKIYVADQGLYTPEKEAIYETYRQKGHFIAYLPFDAGLSYSRNFLLDHVKEPYVFVTDDDIRIRESFDSVLKQFQTDEKLGLVGGQLIVHPNLRVQVYSHKLELENDTLSYTPVKIGYCDIVLNYFVARKEVFDSIRWDENLKLTEHSDFFLRLKYHTEWKVYYEPRFVGDHYPVRMGEYVKYRKRPEFQQKFFSKWGIERTKGI